VNALLIGLVAPSFVLVVTMMAWIVRGLLRLEGRMETYEKLAQWRYDAAEGQYRDLPCVKHGHLVACPFVPNEDAT